MVWLISALLFISVSFFYLVHGQGIFFDSNAALVADVTVVDVTANTSLLRFKLQHYYWEYRNIPRVKVQIYLQTSLPSDFIPNGNVAFLKNMTNGQVIQVNLTQNWTTELDTFTEYSLNTKKDGLEKIAMFKALLDLCFTWSKRGYDKFVLEDGDANFSDALVQSLIDYQVKINESLFLGHHPDQSQLLTFLSLTAATNLRLLAANTSTPPLMLDDNFFSDASVSRLRQLELPRVDTNMTDETLGGLAAIILLLHSAPKITKQGICAWIEARFNGSDGIVDDKYTAMKLNFKPDEEILADLNYTVNGTDTWLIETRNNGWRRVFSFSFVAGMQDSDYTMFVNYFASAERYCPSWLIFLLVYLRTFW